MKKLYYLNCIIILVILISIKSNSESYSKLSGIIQKNLNNIKRINESIKAYQQSNDLFHNINKVLKNNPHGKELIRN